MPPSGISETDASRTFGTALAPHRETADVVRPGLEPLLDGFADADVLALDLVGEVDGLPDRLLDRRAPGFAEEPLENRQRAAGRERHDEVRRKVVRVHV